MSTIDHPTLDDVQPGEYLAVHFRTGGFDSYERIVTGTVTKTTKTQLTVSFDADGRKHTMVFTRRTGAVVGAAGNAFLVRQFNQEAHDEALVKHRKRKAVERIRARVAALEKSIQNIGIDPSDKYHARDWSKVDFDVLQGIDRRLLSIEGVLLGMEAP